MTLQFKIHPADNDNLKVPIKQSSQSWVKLALDPFHDYPVDFAGMPDSHGDQTSIRTYHFVQSVTVPPTVSSGGKWDLSVIAMPLLGPTLLRRANMANPAEYSFNANTIFTANTVIICPRTAGTGIYSNNADTPNYIPIGPSDLDDQVPCRIVAGGFEVHNTTPALHAGGSCMVRSTGSSRSVVQLYNTDDTATSVANIIKGPVNEPQRAAADPQARIWSAKEGCYVPFRLTLDNTDFHYPSSNSKLIYTGFGAGENNCWVTDNSVYLSNNTAFNKRPVREGNIEVSSAHFTGLPYETTLEVTVKVIVEFSPTTKLSELALARPACPYDPKALAEYRNAVADLPPGVKVNMNAKGDWWKMVKKAVHLASPLASFFGPEGAIIAKGINAAVDAADAPISAHYAKINERKRAKQNSIKSQSSPASGRNAARNDLQRLAPVPAPRKKSKARKMVYGYYDSDGVFHETSVVN